LQKGFLNFIQDFEALVVLAKVEALFSLSDSAQKGGIFFLFKTLFCCAQKLDCFLKVWELATD